jgi:predicted HTH domain antitoxin
MLAENFSMNETIELTLPKTVDVSDFELKMIIAAKLYELGRLSSGQAAEVAGLSKRAFIELLGKYNVSVFGYDADELAEDSRN